MELRLGRLFNLVAGGIVVAMGIVSFVVACASALAISPVRGGAGAAMAEGRSAFRFVAGTRIAPGGSGRSSGISWASAASGVASLSTRTDLKPGVSILSALSTRGRLHAAPLPLRTRPLFVLFLFLFPDRVFPVLCVITFFLVPPQDLVDRVTRLVLFRVLFFLRVTRDFRRDCIDMYVYITA